MRWIASVVAAACLLAAGAARPGAADDTRRSAGAAKAHLDAAPAAAHLAARLAARPDLHRAGPRALALPPFAVPAASPPPPAPRGSSLPSRTLVIAAADQARPACSSRGPPRG